MSQPFHLSPNGIPTYDAEFLRRAAEFAASIRSDEGIPIYVFVTDDGDLDYRVGGSPPANTVFEVDTKSVRKGRTAPERVEMVHEGIPTENLAKHFDAVFWTESAVEKFVLPYYASLAMSDAASALRDITKAWYGKDPCLLQDGASTGSDEVIPFALAHTPDSNWKTLPDDFHVVFKAEGKVQTLPVSKFLREHWRQDD